MGNGRVRVLAVDPELLEAVPSASRAAAREALNAHAFSAAPGSWTPDGLAYASGLGILVLEGLLTRNVEVAGTRSREILGAGDVLRPWDDDSVLDPLPSTTSWTVLEEATFAVLDQRWNVLAARWPDLGAEILRRIVRRSRWLAVLLAIANTRGVDGRVLLLFWHLAGSWGRVTSAGTLVPFGLTHEVIADLVGARRPSVTTALAGLEREGKLERIEDGWLLRGDPPVSAR
ncbi:MAG TPA: Crp/Fnr family transcriptional regulator [Solirubrobacterales bacterium]|jgi:CRP-like cAMP-binding protein